MKRFFLTALVSLALLASAHAQTAGPAAKAGLASDQNPFAAGSQPAAAGPAAGASAHIALASDSPAPAAESAARPATEPAGQAAGAPTPARQLSLSDLPSSRGLH